jgi:hypothetical protein
LIEPLSDWRIDETGSARQRVREGSAINIALPPAWPIGQAAPAPRDTFGLGGFGVVGAGFFTASGLARSVKADWRARARSRSFGFGALASARSS